MLMAVPVTAITVQPDSERYKKTPASQKPQELDEARPHEETPSKSRLAAKVSSPWGEGAEGDSGGIMGSMNAHAGRCAGEGLQHIDAGVGLLVGVASG